MDTSGAVSVGLCPEVLERGTVVSTDGLEVLHFVADNLIASII